MARSRTWARWLVCVAVSSALSGCAHGAASSPEDVVQAFARDVREGRYERAYGRLSARVRGEMSLEAFVARIESDEAEARAMAARLERTAGPATRTATLRYGDGETLELVYEDGAYRIVGNVVDPYDQSTPRAAVRAFVRAAENHRYDVLLRLAPAADREGMDEETLRRSFEGEGREDLERLVHTLRENADNPIEQAGDHATMPYLDRFRVELVREDGLWRIVDPD